jgi:hypothetical protein
VPRPFKRTRKEDFTVKLSPDEREVLRSLPAHLRELLGTDDPALFRLFPPANGDEADAELEREYRRLMGDDLLEHHKAALYVLETTVDRDRLTEEELLGWLAALNDLRLVLGTRLDVTEDMDVGALDANDPRQPVFALYHYLTWLQDEAVTALSQS